MSNILRSQERDDVLVHVAGNLRQLRQAAGFSQAALSTASGVSRRTIVALEGGDANISLSNLDKIAAVLDVSFVDLVRDPTRTSRGQINQVAWRGATKASEGVLLTSVMASTEAQLWMWSLGTGDHYTAEPDPEGWSEMIYVVEGVLTLNLSGIVRDYPAGEHAAYSTAQTYSYANHGPGALRFLRNVIS